MDLVIIFTVGIALLVFLWAGRRLRSPEGAGSPGDLNDNLDYMVRLPPRALLGRCLSIEDVEFATSLHSRGVLRLLLSERRRLALEWMRQTRREAGRLFGAHVRAARHAADLKPRAELRLLFHFGLFLVVYQILAGMVRLYGPFHTQGFVHVMHALAGVLSSLGGRIADSIAPRGVLGTATAR